MAVDVSLRDLPDGDWRVEFVPDPNNPDDRAVERRMQFLEEIGIHGIHALLFAPNDAARNAIHMLIEAAFALDQSANESERMGEKDGARMKIARAHLVQALREIVEPKSLL